MPFFRNSFEDEKQAQQGQAQPGGLKLAGGSGGQTSALAGASGAQSSQKASTGSGFQNLDNYLSANDAQGFGKQVGAKVQGDLTQGKEKFSQAAGQVVNQIGQSGVVPSESDISGALADPAKADTSQYNSWVNQTYQGPKSLQDNQQAASQAYGAINNAANKAKMVGSEAGRFSLLDSYFGKPQYNFGEKSLDNLLVQRGGGLDNVSQIQNQAASLKNYAKQEGQNIQGMAAQREGLVNQSREQARKAIGLGEDGQISGGALGGFQDSLQSKVDAENAAREARYNDLYGDMADRDYTPATLEALGLKAGDNLYGVDPRTFLQKGAQATAANVSNADEYARYQALAKMAGVNPTLLTEENMDELGSLGKNQVNIDNEGLSKAIGAKASAYNKANNELTSKLSQSQALLDRYSQELQDGDYAAHQRAIKERQNLEALQAQKAALDKQYDINTKAGRAKAGVSVNPATISGGR